MQVLQLLTLGLLSASTAAASRCKPSAVLSSASVSSSVSPSVSPSSSAASPSASAVPPVCVRNVLQNGYFADGSLDGWSTGAFGSAFVTGETGCGQFGSCVLLGTGAGGYSPSVWQTIANTGVGYTYTFTFDYTATSTLSTNAVLTCQINGEADLVWTKTASDIPVGNWGYFMTTFVSPATSLTLICSVTGTGANNIELTYLNISC